MFTGIIEEIGQIVGIDRDGTNIHFRVRSNLGKELRIDQSVAHDGVCLTVVDIKNDVHTVTAINETLLKTNLSDWKQGATVNLERCMPAHGRFDGHIVQGHVDTVGEVRKVEEVGGSWNYTFGFPDAFTHLLEDKGSVCINGVSLTVVKAESDQFSVTIIPYTYEHTNFHALKVGKKVNLEFDILGKYMAKLREKQQGNSN